MLDLPVEFGLFNQWMYAGFKQDGVGFDNRDKDAIDGVVSLMAAGHLKENSMYRKNHEQTAFLNYIVNNCTGSADKYERTLENGLKPTVDQFYREHRHGEYLKQHKLV
ncbi:MAG: hypothetical protein ACQESE_02500 [Nanobdellota archaeon]